MRRAIPSLLWLAAMYAATAFSEAAPPLRLIEWQRIAIHTTGYLILALAMAYAVRPASRRTILTLLALAALAGLGQEAIQSIARQRVYAVASLFDVGVDTVGAWLGLLIVRRLRKTRPLSPRPLNATNRPRSESNEVTERSESR
jgi:VanZ family protein